VSLKSISALQKQSKKPIVRDQTYKIFCQLVFFITRPFLPCSIPYDLITEHDILTQFRKRKETVKDDMHCGGQELALTRNNICTM